MEADSNKRRRIDDEAVAWTRDDIVCCNCSELKSRHVHCPCSKCNGAAVARSVEHSHWQQQQQEIADIVVDRVEDPGDTNNDSGIDECILPPSGDDNLTHDHCSVLSENQTSAQNLCSRPCSPDSMASDTTDNNEIDHDDIEITIAILKSLNLVDQMSGSISDFEDILQFSKELFCRNDRKLEERWPRNWQETQSVLKNCGYKAPRELYVCLDESHYAQWDVMEKADETCRHCGKAGKIKYYYLGISDKVELWCANRDMCKKMMAHWKEKDHWIEGEGANFTLKEIWDGERFNELSWFWKPDSEWMLPVKCKFCTNIISVDEMKECPQEDGRYEITCPECGTRWEQTPSYATGDPRNIALIGHWDGWQPFGYPGAHSCGAIEVTIANMAKAERCSTDQIYVVGFVPSYQLPKSRPCSLDPFLHPLISDIEDIFIDGLEVDYVESFPGLPAGRIILRILILLWTGDYPAQHEVGKFIKHGILPCRRDKLKGTINPEGGSTYYYVNNRYHARFAWEERKLEEDLKMMKDINEEDRKTVRAEKSRNSGYTGLSVLYRLHKLYGFDIFKDLVYDTMHNLPSNVIAAQLKSFITLEKIDSKLVDQRLRFFPWTAELKDGRIPNGYGSRLAFWKAEELHKFAFPASEVIFADLLEDMDYHIWQLTVRMTELVFCKRDGWVLDDVHLFSKLAQRYLVLTEEHRGLTSCTVTEHNLLHIPDDAMRFSHPDNYWCFPFERAVRRYVTTKSNFKNIECTYAKKEARRELLQHLSSSIKDQPKQYKFCLEKMSATSLEGARHLSDIAKTSPRHENYSKKGILVGGSERNEVQLSKQDVDLIKSKFTGSSTSSGEVLVPEIALAYRSLLLPQQGIQGQGLLYRTGEHVFLNMNNVQSVVLVEKFLGLEIEGEYHKFIQGQLLPTKQDDDGKLVTFASTGFPILCHGSLSQKIIVPAPSILRKAIVFPNPSEPLESIVVDFMRKSMPLSPNDVVVPLYPKEGEMVFINGTDPQPWFRRVLSVDANHQIAKVLYYNKVGEREDVYGSVIAMYSPERNPRLASDKVSWNTLLHNADGDWNEDIWEMVPVDY